MRRRAGVGQCVAGHRLRSVRIDPASGVVNAVVDASGLLGQPRTNSQVLNGIAHISGDEFLLTGKYWPSAFRVRFDPPI